MNRDRSKNINDMIIREAIIPNTFFFASLIYKTSMFNFESFFNFEEKKKLNYNNNYTSTVTGEFWV